jgi:iron complex transport system permease protein
VFVPPAETAAIILSGITGNSTGADIRASTFGIIWNLRLPRVLLAFLAGAALSASGAVMQSVLRNPLSSSYTLGVSAGASLGAGVMMLFGVGAGFAGGAVAGLSGFASVAGTLAVPFAGFVFSLLSIAAVMFFSRAVDPRLDNNTIILSGMIFSLFISATLTLVSALAADSMQRLLYWQMGSFAMKGWEAVAVLAPVLAISGILLMALSRELDILTFGDDEAASLGVSVRKTKRALIGIASVLTGCTIAFTGVIGFLDLAVPHIVRRIFGPAHRRVIPFSVLFGGVFMVLADLVARTAIPAIDLPVGAVTALVGAPFFAWVYLRSRKEPA